MKLVLDTHILLWWIEGEGRLSRRQTGAIHEAGQAAEPLLVSDITLWEIATLFELGRIRLTIPLRDWLERATAPPLVRSCPITPAVAAEVASLPRSFHRDPADRIIVSTARVYGARLVTADRRIAKSELVPTIG